MMPDEFTDHWLDALGDDLYGVVWCGVVWCGVVWCGVVWCGVVWCGVPKALLPNGNGRDALHTGNAKWEGCVSKLCVWCVSASPCCFALLWGLRCRGGTCAYPGCGAFVAQAWPCCAPPFGLHAPGPTFCLCCTIHCCQNWRCRGQCCTKLLPPEPMVWRLAPCKLLVWCGVVWCGVVRCGAVACCAV